MLEELTHDLLKNLQTLLTGEEGRYHYRPLMADGRPIEVATNSPYANRCMFDAIAHQLEIRTDTLIFRLQRYLKNKNPVAQEMYEENIQDIFPEFTGGNPYNNIIRSVPNAAVLIRDRIGNIETVRSSLGIQQVRAGSSVTERVRNSSRNDGCPGDDAGHILARMLGGRGDTRDNVDPMQSTLNRGQYRAFELFLMNMLVENPTHRVDTLHEIFFNSDSERPRRPELITYNAKFYDLNGKVILECKRNFSNPLPFKKN